MGGRGPAGAPQHAVHGGPERFRGIGGAPAEWAADPESDFAALAEGRISVTPLHLDLTNHRVLAEMRDWNLAP